MRMMRQTVLCVAAVGVVLLGQVAAAQTPAPAPQAAPPAPGNPQTPPAPAPAPPAGSPPAAAPAPPSTAAPSVPGPAGTTATFGEEITFPEKTIVFMKGSANWDTAFDTLVDSFKSLQGFMDKQGLKAEGPSLTIYLSTDDTGFQFQAAVPIAGAPANPPRGDIEVGKSPSGRMLRFVHRGSYDSMDSTYEMITNYLDTKQLDSQDTFIEEYVTDPVQTEEDKLIINVYVPLKSK